MAQDSHRHTAIYALHDNVAYVLGDENGVKAYDANDQEVAYDSAAVEAKATQVEADENLAALRVERNKRLVETDYWDASDTPVMSQAQIEYRQALRDITTSATSLGDVTWPTAP